MNGQPQHVGLEGVVEKLNTETNARQEVQADLESVQNQLNRITEAMMTAPTMSGPTMTSATMHPSMSFGFPAQPQFRPPLRGFVPPLAQPIFNFLPQIHELNNHLQALQQKFDKSGETIDDLYAQVNYVKYELNEQKQYNQRNNLIAHGWDDVPIAPAKPTQEYHEEFTNYVVDKLNDLFPGIQGGISARDIDDTHILRTKKSKRESSKQLVIIRFCSRLVRNRVFSLKKELRGKGLSLTEHLTQFNLGLLKEAQYRLKDVRRAWTHYGKVLLSINGEIKSVKNYFYLDKLLPPRRD